MAAPEFDFESPDLESLVGEIATTDLGAIDFDGENDIAPAGDTLCLDTSKTLKRRAAGRELIDLSKVRNAVAQIQKLPGREESLHCLMGGDFNGWDLVPAIHSLSGRAIDELVITTLGFNHKNMSQLCGMLDAGDICKVEVLCSHYFKGADADVFQFAEEELKRRGQRIAATRNHSKIILFAIGRARYVVESSANLRTCNNIEQFTLTNSATLFEFHRRWILDVISRSEVRR